jgi:hypothetical protein
MTPNLICFASSRESPSPSSQSAGNRIRSPRIGEFLKGRPTASRKKECFPGSSSYLPRYGRCAQASRKRFFAPAHQGSNHERRAHLANCGAADMSGRGLAAESLELIDASRSILVQIQPATVRGVCYQLFTHGVIASMQTSETQKVSRLLVRAREQGIIPWDWIVDETREPERISAWRDISDYGQTIVKSYRKDFWQRQDERVEVWSEKGTVRGVLAPVLDDFAVTVSVKHGFDSATSVNGVACQTADKERPLIVFYVGDWDRPMHV